MRGESASGVVMVSKLDEQTFKKTVQYIFRLFIIIKDKSYLFALRYHCVIIHKTIEFVKEGTIPVHQDIHCY